MISAVEEKLEEVNDILPEGVRLVPYYQQKSLVEAAVRTVTTALLVGIALVAVVLLVFMGGVRASIVVALSIPFSLLSAFIGMRLFGLSANLMSFGGLAIAIGMMVDGTIVMVENIDRMLRDAKPGESRLEIIGQASQRGGADQSSLRSRSSSSSSCRSSLFRGSRARPSGHLPIPSRWPCSDR